ncbi:SRPBCC family protein [Ramlibacter sp. 2FC]|uniref:SRPBCC family protein n=1 Tax=Ramlibacter sp. 2FC TaxID=2502188 RepID=UPI0010F7E3C6|nr:SRPBCC family protein [Ramlibacter sp. 2FC]
MSTDRPAAAAPDPREIFSSRLLDWPPAQVFQACAQPERLARWWGPSGFRSSFHAFDFRPGGDWRFTMHGPDGTDYPNHNRFVEIQAPERIVIEHLAQPHHFVLTLTLEAEGQDQTRLGFRQRFDDAAERERVAAFAIPANEQNLDRLQAELARN